jgi:hypothetical protein
MALYLLAPALANPVGAEWELVYDDSQAVVFMRRPPPGSPALSNKLGRMLRHMETVCKAYVENSPDYPLCARTLADYWLHNQERIAAIAESTDESVCPTLAHVRFAFLWGRRFRPPTDCFTASEPCRRSSQGRHPKAQQYRICPAGASRNQCRRRTARRCAG